MANTSPWSTTNKSHEGDGIVIHGPAAFIDRSHTPYLSSDNVCCLRCLLWPRQANNWSTRHRSYGWPDSATRDRYVSNGCDVVMVAHRQCRQHEWMGKYQWRMSFSRAEVVLVNSWMPVQQIIYHLLRYFIKTERLTDCVSNSGASTLSNYHIKTLMLWACELKSRRWWTEDLNFVRICVELMQTLSVWLTDTRCPHYFINNYCNLLDNSFNVKNVANKLMSINEECLSSWLIKNYIGQCTRVCSAYILRLFDDVSSSTKLQNAVSEIVRWRLSTSLDDLWQSFYFSEHTITLFVSSLSLTGRSCVCWMNELTKIDKRLSVYFSAVALLHVACTLTRFGFTDKLIDIVSTVLGPNLSESWNDLALRISRLPASELVELLQKYAVEHLITYRHFLVRDFCSVATIVTTDFAAMYAYKRGDYQRCLQLSTQNVHTLLFAVYISHVPTFPEFIQLLDDDIVSLTALMLIIKPKCRTDHSRYVTITQLTLSLYLMTRQH